MFIKLPSLDSIIEQINDETLTFGQPAGLWAVQLFNCDDGNVFAQFKYDNYEDACCCFEEYKKSIMYTMFPWNILLTHVFLVEIVGNDEKLIEMHPDFKTGKML